MYERVELKWGQTRFMLVSLFTYCRGKWNLEREALNYRIGCRNRNAITTGPIATLYGIRGSTLIQMSDGICSVRLETDFNIKRAAHARRRVCLPTCALNGIGKFTDWRLPLLWIGTRVVPKLRLAHVFHHLYMTSAIGPGVRF